MILTIYVASTSKVKLQAVKDAFQNRFESVAVEGCENILSEIPEQPIGLEQTKVGCANRLKNLRNQLYERGIVDFQYAVAIENGICLDDERDLPYDIGVIMIYDATNNVAVFEILTEKVYFDKAKYNKTIELNQSITVGDLFAEMNGYNSKDWHMNVDPQQRSRETLLTLAITNHLQTHS
jgi:hypothetical protein